MFEELPACGPEHIQHRVVYAVFSSEPHINVCTSSSSWQSFIILCGVEASAMDRFRGTLRAPFRLPICHSSPFQQGSLGRTSTWSSNLLAARFKRGYASVAWHMTYAGQERQRTQALPNANGLNHKFDSELIHMIQLMMVSMCEVALQAANRAAHKAYCSAVRATIEIQHLRHHAVSLGAGFDLCKELSVLRAFPHGTTSTSYHLQLAISCW
jgi:hypothetical protein